MAEDEAASPDEEPSVELGDAGSVQGAPVARVASRLTWPIEQSEVVRKEGDTVIRTEDGPRAMSDVLEAVDTTYFASRQEFIGAIRAVAGIGPIPTE